MTGRRTGDPRDRTRGRADASMSLLSDLVRVPDPGYAAAARRRERGGTGRGRGSATLLTVALVGALFAVAGAEAQRREPVAAAQRERLVGEIRARTAATDAQARRAAALRAETGRLRTAALARSAEGRRTRRELAAVAARAHTAPASGPALVVTVDDAAEGRSRVYDQDLQLLVNALWAAGARAVAVNGQRLTATAAIRAAGEAILVDHRPLGRPYTVVALGDPGRLAARLDGSPADRLLTTLRDRSGLRYQRRTDDGARLPAGNAAPARYARPAGTP